MDTLVSFTVVREVEIKSFTVVREVLCNDHPSHSLIGPYRFLRVAQEIRLHSQDRFLLGSDN